MIFAERAACLWAERTLESTQVLRPRSSLPSLCGCSSHPPVCPHLALVGAAGCVAALPWDPASAATANPQQESDGICFTGHKECQVPSIVNWHSVSLQFLLDLLGSVFCFPGWLTCSWSPSHCWWFGCHEEVLSEFAAAIVSFEHLGQRHWPLQESAISAADRRNRDPLCVTL